MRREVVQDAAAPCLLITRALLAERFELLLKQAKLADAAGDMGDVLIEQGIDLATFGLRVIFEAQEHTDFIQGHVQ